MRIAILFLSALILLKSSVGLSEGLINKLQQLEKKSDDLGIRILIRKNFNTKLSIKDWFEIRKILTRRPKVGFDAITAWDRQVSLKSSNLQAESDKVQALLDKADELTMNREFEKSFDLYQRAAKYIKASNKGKIPKGNQQLYLNILHQMARSLYSQKRYSEALEVYSWISPVYPQIRQVLFEKMWAAFRTNKYDIALGAISSQQSGYFSEYLHPESYLLKIYIFKRLCRKKDLVFTVNSIKNYLNGIKSGKFNYLEWARTDLYYLSLAQLIESSKDPEKGITEIVSVKERTEELRKINEALKIKFNSQKPILITQLERVYGYASLALGNDQDVLKPLGNLPETKVLEKKGYELWPSGDAEEWLDEIGSHVFIGKSECNSDEGIKKKNE